MTNSKRYDIVKSYRTQRGNKMKKQYLYKGFLITKCDMSGLGFASFWHIEDKTKNGYKTLKAAKAAIDNK